MNHTDVLSERKDHVLPGDPAKSRKALFERLEKIKYAMFVTLTGDGPHARPMTTQRAEEPGVVWFFTQATGEFAQEIEANPNVLLSYADTSDIVYVGLNGTAKLHRDPAKAKEMWSPLARAWFPDGPEDPNLALLEVRLQRGDVWSPEAGKLVAFLSMAAAAITRTQPEHAGEHHAFEF